MQIGLVHIPDNRTRMFLNLAREAGISEHVWPIEEIVSLLDRGAKIAA